MNFIKDLFYDDSGRPSMSKTILGIVTLVSCVIMLNMAYNDRMSAEYFIAFLAFGTSHASMNKFLDSRKTTSGVQ